MNIRPEIKEWIDLIKRNPTKRGLDEIIVERLDYLGKPAEFRIEPGECEDTLPCLFMDWSFRHGGQITLWSLTLDKEELPEVVRLTEEEQKQIGQAFLDEVFEVHVEYKRSKIDPDKEPPPRSASREKEILEGARPCKLS